MSSQPSSLELSPVTSPGIDVGGNDVVGATIEQQRVEPKCISYNETEDVNKVSRFLQDGGNIDAIPFPIPYYPLELQWTLLHWAAYYNALECVRLLLDKGANRNRKNSDGKTPLEVAKLRQTEQIKELEKTQQKPSTEMLEKFKLINELLGTPPPSSA